MTFTVAAPGHLHLVCRKCTREVGFAGDTREVAEAAARKAGWIIEQVAADRQTAVCPKCPATRHTFHDPVGLTVSMGATAEQHEAAAAAKFDDLGTVTA